jgi:hypothetical protein
MADGGFDVSRLDPGCWDYLFNKNGVAFPIQRVDGIAVYD